MRLIYTDKGFSKTEKEEWRIIIFHNILDGLRMTVEAMNDFNTPFEHESTKVGPSSNSLSILRSLSQDIG